MENINKIFISFLISSVFFYYIKISFVILLISILLLAIIFHFVNIKLRELIILSISFLIIGVVYLVKVETKPLVNNKVYLIEGIKSDNKIKVLTINKKISKNKIYLNTFRQDIQDGKYEFEIKLTKVKKINNIFFGYAKVISYKDNIFNKWRNKIRNQIEKFSLIRGYDFFAFLKAILLGEKNELDTSLVEKYRYSGAAHLLVISGLHIGIMILFVLKCLESFQIGYKSRYVVASLILTGYVLILGSSPSILRAYIMGIIFLISKILNEETDIKKSIALAGIITLLLNPTLILDVSFQLSYMALFGIIYIYPFLKKDQMNPIIELALVSISIQIALFPIFLYYFHTLTILTMLTNILVIPIGTLLVTSSFFILILSFISMEIAIILSYFLNILYEILNFYVLNISKIPILQIKTYKYISVFIILLLYILIIFILYYKKYGIFKKIIISVISILIVMNINFKKEPNILQINTNKYIKTNLEHKVIIINDKLKENDIFELKKSGVKKIDIVFTKISINVELVKKVFKSKKVKILEENERAIIDNIEIVFKKDKLEGKVIKNK